MLPPRPPSPPSGPPLGTYLKRAKEQAPEPPVPATTRTITRSTKLTAPPGPRVVPPRSSPPPPPRRPEQRPHDVESLLQRLAPRPGAARAEEVRMELPFGSLHRDLRHAATFPPRGGRSEE